MDVARPVSDCLGMAPRDIERLAALAATIDQESAQDAGSLAYQARLFAQTSLPCSDPGDVAAWGRNNGGVSIVIQPGMYREERTQELRSVGYPYGNIPRLLLAWMSTEAVRTKSRTLYLGESVSEFMRELGLIPSGGPHGTRQRLHKQLRRLLLARIVCIVDRSSIGFEGAAVFGVADGYWLWWDPKEPNTEQEQLLQSTISLSEAFFEQVTTRPVPIDMRVLKRIKGSALAIDIYTWLTYRLSYLQRPVRVSWAQLRGQFGTNFADTRFGHAGFRRKFEAQLGNVLELYRDANVQTSHEGLVLLPSRPHVSRKSTSRQLQLPSSSVPLPQPEKDSKPSPQVVERYCVHGGEAGILPDGTARCPSCRRS